MKKETLNAQEIEHLRDHGTLPPEEPVAAVELAKEEPADTGTRSITDS